MSAQQRWLIVCYALVAMGALVATWSQNLQLMTPGTAPFEPFAVFLEQTKVNPGSRSITVDIGFLFMAAAAFMVIEARRLGVGFVWLYILGGFMIAISVTFPLFMIARELRIARAPDAPSAWRLTSLDLVGLAVVTGALVYLVCLVLS